MSGEIKFSGLFLNADVIDSLSGIITWYCCDPVDISGGGVTGLSSVVGDGLSRSAGNSDVDVGVGFRSRYGFGGGESG